LPSILVNSSVQDTSHGCTGQWLSPPPGPPPPPPPPLETIPILHKLDSWSKTWIRTGLKPITQVTTGLKPITCQVCWHNVNSTSTPCNMECQQLFLQTILNPANSTYGNPLRTEVYFCHQNQNAKNIGNFTTLLKPHNIGTQIETNFQVVPLIL
jgi:hypothetical protein